MQKLYDPEKAKKDFPEANFMSAEQTFAWQGQFNDQNSLSLHDSSFDKKKKPLYQSLLQEKSKTIASIC